MSLSPSSLPDNLEETVQLATTSLMATEIISGEQPAALQTPRFADLMCFAGAFGSTFLTVLLAELGDKTQLTTLLMSAESHAPWTVFLGASCALVLTSLLGVLVGQWLACKVSPQTLQKASGICLVFIAVGLLWDTLGH